VTVPARCACTHSQYRHVGGHGYCQARMCRCSRYLEPAPWPSDEEQAVIDKFGIFEEEQ